MAAAALVETEGTSKIGLGSGAAVAAFARALGHYVKKRRRPLVVVPSSTQIQLVAERAGLTVAGVPGSRALELTVDGADEIDEEGRMIKGGGGALLKEKVLLTYTKRRVILAEDSKFVPTLKKRVPVEIHPFARAVIMRQLTAIGGKPQLRLLPKGYPYCTENGNLILDTDFGVIADPKRLEAHVGGIPGVLAVGLFTMPIDRFYRGWSSGRVEALRLFPR